jgi:pimeloyl-ACP methyl ester carboxylesterase
MANGTVRVLVTEESPTRPRAPHGAVPCRGIYHHPAGIRPTTAMIATHYEADFSEHYLAGLLAARGYGFLGWNTRYTGDGHRFILEHALVDIGVGVRWLREQAGVEHVVLLGNSGGASLMAAYQSQAIGPNVQPTPWGELPDAVLDLPAADALVVLCAHPGRPDVLTAWLDPSVTDESDPLSRDPSLDMFDPANGPPYTPEFIERYRAAQEARNARITAWVFAEHERLTANGGSERVFPVFRAWADLRFLDLSLDPSPRRAGCYVGDASAANSMGQGLADACTLRSWLSMWSLSTSQCRAGPHLARITVPALVVEATDDRGCYPSDAARIYDDLASKDKQRAVLTADHYLRHPADARDGAADLIVGWLEEHV